MSDHLYPLAFTPIFQNYLWGGTRLRELLHKQTGAGRWAESWEVVDHAKAQSLVSQGPLRGHSLHQLITHWGPQLVGQRVWRRINDPALPRQLRGRFPLLLKILDAALDLSIQVHPNDEQAARRSPPDLGKSEAWVVLDAEPGARWYAGTLPGATAESFRQAIEDGSAARWMHSFEPQVGDCIYIPAGTLHAIGAGLLLAEIQQASDTTYRVFDWNRVDASGQPRALQIDEALRVADFSRGPVGAQRAQRLQPDWVEHYVASPYFRIRRWQPPYPIELESMECYRILLVVAGGLNIEAAGVAMALERGSSVLLPAAIDGVRVTPSAACTWLEYLPGTLDLPDEPPPSFRAARG